jgi:hypothetical protein
LFGCRAAKSSLTIAPRVVCTGPFLRC